MKNQKNKLLDIVDMLNELPFYDELNIVKIEIAFEGYARSFSIELIKDKVGTKKDPLAQLTASKTSIKYLFRDLLIEIKRFKY